MRHASFWWRGRRPARSGGGAPRPAPLGGGAPRHFEWVFKQRSVAVTRSEAVTELVMELSRELAGEYFVLYIKYTIDNETESVS